MGVPIEEDVTGSEGMAPTPVADRSGGGTDWKAIIQKLETDLKSKGGGPQPGSPLSPATPGAAAAPPRPGSVSSISEAPGPPPDPLGISGIEARTPVEQMSPDKQALARSVFGLARKGSAYIGQKGEDLQATYEDFPKTLPEFYERMQKPENVRATLRGVGGAAGGVGGFALGGYWGSVVGTGAGSTAGGYLANAYDEMRNWAQQSGEKPETVDKLMQPVMDGLWDATISGGVVSLPYILSGSKYVLSRMLKLPPNSRELMEEASTIGVDIGVANVANGGIGKGAVNVFGRMPLIGGSAGKAAQQQAKAISAAYEDMFGPLTNPSSTTEIGQAALNEARAKYTEWAVPAIQRYEHALRVGEADGSVLPTDRVLKATGEVIAQFASKQGKLLGQMPADMRTYLNGIVKNLEGETMTAVDANNLLVGLENLSRKAMGEKGVFYSQLDRVKEAVTMTLRESDTPGAKLLVKARQSFLDGLEEFQTGIYQKMVGKVDRNIFALGKMKESTLTADELMDVAAKIKSPAQINELRDAGGDAIVRNVARTKLDDAWVRATGKEPGTFAKGDKFEFDAKTFNKTLGLDNPKGGTYATLEETLRGTGVAMEDIAKLSRVAEAVANAPIHDASTFMARAAVLRGAGGVSEAVKSVLTFGAAGTMAHQAGFIPAMTGVLMLRWGVGKMMKPGLIQLVTQAGDTNAAPAVQAAAMLQIARNWPSLFNE